MGTGPQAFHPPGTPRKARRVRSLSGTQEGAPSSILGCLLGPGSAALCSVVCHILQKSSVGFEKNSLASANCIGRVTMLQAPEEAS